MRRRRDGELIANIDMSVFGVLVIALFAWAATEYWSNCFHCRSQFVDIPKWSTSKLQYGLDDHSLYLAVTHDGRLYFGSESVTQEKLAHELRDMRHCLSDGKLYIRADQRARYGLVMDMIDRAHEAGIRDVVFLEEQRWGSVFEECCVAR